MEDQNEKWGFETGMSPLWDIMKHYVPSAKTKKLMWKELGKKHEEEVRKEERNDETHTLQRSWVKTNQQ